MGRVVKEWKKKNGVWMYETAEVWDLHQKWDVARKRRERRKKGGGGVKMSEGGEITQ